MTGDELLRHMVAPGTRRAGKYRQGVIQIWVTRACDKSCYGCTQGSNLGGNPGMITVEQFEQAVISLRGYFGVVGVFGGNPCLHPKFPELCAVLRKHVPKSQRGLWSNNPCGHGKVCRETFDPSVSNLNVHLDAVAYAEFKRDWPECNPVGLRQDSRHSPVHLAMKDLKWLPTVETAVGQEAEPQYVSNTEEHRNDLIATCDINQHWSAMIGVFRGQLRAWFCEVAGAQAMLHQHEPDYPDTGVKIMSGYGADGLSDFSLGDGKGVRTQWWKMGMEHYAHQVRKHCHECAVPLRGYGELACSSGGAEQTSATHEAVFRPKRAGRAVELVTTAEQLRPGRISRTTSYLQNAAR